jgi:hypothetical protein
MPVIEEEASVDSACISTAPVFKKTAAKATPKQLSDSWWAVYKVSYDGYDTDSSLVSVFLRRSLGTGLHNFGKEYGISIVWSLWIVAVMCANLIPATHMLEFLGYLTLVLLSCAWIPDSGETVIPYLLILVLIPTISVKCMAAGGWWTACPFLFIFVLLPITETLVGVELTNQTAEKQKELHYQFPFKLLTLLVVPTQLAIIAYGCWWGAQEGRGLGELMGACCCVGIFTGAIGITVGHELCHKASALERLCGRVLLSASACAVASGTCVLVFAQLHS